MKIQCLQIILRNLIMISKNRHIEFLFTWDGWSWRRMRRREMEEEVEGVMLCTVQQLRRRSGQASDPSRKSSVCRCSTLLSRPSPSSIREPATKWGSSHGKQLGDDEEKEACSEEVRGKVSSFTEVYMFPDLSSCVKECSEMGCLMSSVDFCTTSCCCARSSCGEWGRPKLNDGQVAFTPLEKCSTFLSLLLTCSPLYFPLLCHSGFKLLSLNVLSCSQPHPPPAPWKLSLIGEMGLNLEGRCG